MLAAATTSLFGKSSSLSAYTIHTTPTSTPSSSTLNLAATQGQASRRKPLSVGLWKVLSGTHKTTGKDVSVWIFEKRVIDGVRSPQLKEIVLETLRKEAQSLTKLRHPDLLQITEPLEETRSELTFVTEAITGSLSGILKDLSESVHGPGSDRNRGGGAGLEVDEVEIQKGVLQVSRALSFLHNQAKLVHLNINPDAILINTKGDWKLSGFTHITPIPSSSSSANQQKYVYPEVDNRMPSQVQWKLDYLAPEYIIDGPGSWGTGVDVYSLGCLLFAVHLGGKPPFRNNGSIQTATTHLEQDLVQGSWRGGRRWQEAGDEVRDLLPKLITRHAQPRLSLPTLQSHSYFSSLAISTLNFLDPSNFASKPREEKASFLKGLLRVLPGFSDRLKRRKILPSLLDEMKDVYLLPFLLPDVFEICKTLTNDEFAEVLPRVQPLFDLKDSAQTMLMLIESIPMFAQKTSPEVFRKSVMPLIYHALESEHSNVQEKVLGAIPSLCDNLDYSTLQDILLVKIAVVFTKTTLLTVKVETLRCFLAMVTILDKAVLTQKLVPLLAKIRTKEPSVMMATLAVHEAMGMKVDREAVAGLVLPQLWAMSMGPLLSVDQFGKFMSVIKSLGNRVEREHLEHLRAIRRADEQTSTFAGASANASGFSMNGGGEVDFEALVGSKGNTGGSNGAANGSRGVQGLSLDDPWDRTDDWLASAQATSSTRPAVNYTSSNTPTTPAAGGRLKARPVPASTFNSAAFAAEPAASRPNNVMGSMNGIMQSTPALPPPQVQMTRAPLSPRPAGPNYNISLAPQAPTTSVFGAAPSLGVGTGMMASKPMAMNTTPTTAAPPGWTNSGGMGMGGVLQPTRKIEQASSKKTFNDADWGDFDPLK